MSSERVLQLKRARKTLTIIVFVAMSFFVFFSSFIEISNETLIVAPSPTPTSSPTKMPEVVTVEYQIEVVSESPSVLLEFWYTNELGGTNQKDSTRISNSTPFTQAVVLPSGEHVEVAGVLASGQVGELTCRILVDKELIEHSTNVGTGTGVYCSGVIRK